MPRASTNTPPQRSTGRRSAPTSSRKADRRSRRATPPGLFGDGEDRPLRVVWYRRASTDEANQPYSLDAQEARLRSYSAGHPNWEVVGDYVERASAKDIEGRPKLQQLLTDAAAGKFDTVLVARLDRWSRNLVDCLDTVDYLTEHEVAFHSASEHFDTSTPVGMLLLQMLGMFAQFERSTIIDRIHKGNDAKVAHGLPLTSRVVYGTRLDKHGVLEKDPATFPTVKRIFTDYANLHIGSRTIAKNLTKDGIPAPGTKPWSGTSVLRILGHRSFIGDIWHLETWHPGAHDALLDVELFDAAQNLLAKRAKPAAARSASSDFVLTGTMTCGLCGGAYVGTTGTSRAGKVHRYYSCVSAKRFGAETCAGPSLPADELENIVTTALLETYADHDLFTGAVQAHLDNLAQQHEPLIEQLGAQNILIEARAHVLARYQDDYENGKLSAERYEARATELEEELATLRTHAADLELLVVSEPPQLPNAAELAGLHELLRERLRTGNTAVRKSVFNALIESLVVHGREDIAPTFRLLAAQPAEDAMAAAEQTSGAHPSTAEVAVEGSVFAHRDAGWS